MKSKFEFPAFITATLANVNPRKEMHGDEHRQAIDLSLRTDLPNLGPDLPSA